MTLSLQFRGTLFLKGGVGQEGGGGALSNQIFDCSPTKLLNSKVTKSKVKPNARPVVKTPQGTLLHYIEQLHDEITEMVNEDFIEGLLEKEEEGTYISNLVTYKKQDPK